MIAKKKPVAVSPETARIALIDSIEERVSANLQQIAAPMQAIMKSMEPALAFVRSLNRQLESVGHFKQIADAQRWYSAMLKPTEFVLPLPPPHRHEFIAPARFVRLSDSDKEEIAERAARKVMESAVDHPDTEYVFARTMAGDLFRRSDPKLRLEFGRGKKLSRIIDTLIGRRSPVSSGDLMRATGFKSYKALTNAIGKINARAAVALEYPPEPGYDLVTSKPGPGYLLNRKHLIVPDPHST